jgi:hypothetical protein
VFDGQVAGQRGVEPIAGQTGARAVALPERSDGGHVVAGRDREIAEGVRCGHDAKRPGPVVDRDPEAVREPGRGLRDRAAHRQA